MRVVVTPVRGCAVARRLLSSHSCCCSAHSISWHLTPHSVTRLLQRTLRTLPIVTQTPYPHPLHPPQAERKEYRKAKAEEEEQRRRNKPGHGPAPWGPRDKADEDPDGQRWLHAHDPLEEAAVLVDRMRQFCRDRIGTHVAAFEVHLRRGKRLLALQAVREAVRVGGEGCVEVVAMAARLAVHVRGGAAGAAVANGGEGDGRGAAVEAVLVEGVAALVGADAGAYVQAWGAKHGEASVEHAARLAEVRGARGAGL